MIVYGDPEYRQSARRLLLDLSQRAARDNLQLDDLRAILIRAGQLEQAIADDVPDSEEERLAKRITDYVAAAFYSKYADEADGLVASQFQSCAALIQLCRVLEQKFSDRLLRVKIPEGFQFYTLYPEQYCHATRLWTEHHRGDPNRLVRVVGIRSIGTSLSALVAETLRAFGWQPTRLTVRPKGNPFARVVEISESTAAKASHAIIVDEGPGLSGSSMKAVADALLRIGLQSECISIFPGHDGEPGTAASPKIRAWWRTVPRYSVPTTTLRWSGQSLEEALADQAAAICEGELFDQTADLSAGQWRRLIFPDDAGWPAVATQLERTKILCRSKRQAVLWKFTGLGGNELADSLNASKLLPWLQQPLGIFRGFVALPWIEGRPLTRAVVADIELIQEIARHLSAHSGTPLAAEEHAAAVSRLGHMLYWNVKESLGERLADATTRFADVAAECLPTATYGDGRLAPHEWIRAADGKLWKTDYFGHTNDHTVVGRQSVLWDVAGALIEWDMNSEATETLLGILRKEQSELDLRPLDFYRAAYAAFRLGVYSYAASDDLAEQQRAEIAKRYYRRKLRNLLVQPGGLKQIDSANGHAVIVQFENTDAGRGDFQTMNEVRRHS